MAVEISEIVKTCCYCQSSGEVRRLKEESIFLSCPKCKHKWKTHSEICHKCLQPNGYAVPGLCSSCYSEQYNGL